MEYIEVTGKSVEEAITNACTKLGIPSSKLDYEVIEKGSSGLFGIFNSKPAKIKAKEKSDEEEIKVVKETEKKEVKATLEKAVEKKEAKAEVKTEVKAEVKAEVKSESKPVSEPQSKQESFTSSQKETITKDIKEFLDSMFGAMNMEVTVDITFDDEENSVNVDLSGDNMGVLIGKRGQTLDSIQYLTSLVINKNSEKYVRIKLDTENYRKRRKDTLESLAKNIAYKVKRSRRPVSLEPMNPYERRIIHSALQSDKFVSTRSEGEEPFRHVVVYLERDNNNRYNR